MFEDGVSGLVNDMEVDFSLAFDGIEVPMLGYVRHTGSKYSGIEIKKIKGKKDEFYNYINSKIIKKFQIPSDLGLRGLLVRKVDIKLTLALLILEAFLLIGGILLYRLYTGSDSEFNYLKGSKSVEKVKYGA